MIAKKMKQAVKESSVTRAMFEEGKRLAKLYGPENVFDFSLGNPSVAPPAAVEKAMADVMKNTAANDLHGYMNNAGHASVREKIADFLNQKFDTAFTADNILMTVGAAGGLNVILKAILDPGDEVICFAPYFGEYDNYVANFDGVLVAVPSTPVNFFPDGEKLEREVTAATKAVIINTPNNPTGVVYPESVIVQITEILEKKQKEFGTDIYLIADEPYRELVYDGACVPYLTGYYKNTIVAYSFSKSLSLPGERIGYLVIPDAAADAKDLFSAAVVANRILGFVNAPSLQQLTVAKCLDVTADLNVYDTNRRLLCEKFTELNFSFVKPEGAFYLWVKAPGGDDAEFVRRAKEQNILIVPGSAYHFAGYARIAYCVDTAMLKRSFAAFEKLAESYRL